MKRHQFDHTIRAAAEIMGVKKLLVIGSQAIHGSYDLEFKEAYRSIETDIAAFNDEDNELSDLIDGSIGEGSMFQETHGYYAQGVSQETAKLPPGWKDRLVPYQSEGTAGVIAYCLEPHDLWISKALAGREKDWRYVRALNKLKILDKNVLKQRLQEMTSIAPEKIKLALANINK